MLTLRLAPVLTTLVSIASLATVVSLSTACAGADGGTADEPNGASAGALVHSESDGLTQNQQDDVLQKIDDHCSDSWCENGEYDFAFRSLVCTFSSATCTMKVRASKLVNRPKHPRDYFNRQCTLQGISGYHDMMTPGQVLELTPDFLKKLDRCMTEVGDSLH